MQVYSEHSHQDLEDLADCSSVLRIQNLQIALEKAIQDIALLQDSLGYVIKVKEELETQLSVKDQREETILKEYQREINKKEREIESLRLKQQELVGVLEETKCSRENGEMVKLQREDEVRRFERIVEDQKRAIQAMEEELLATKYNADMSYQSFTQDNMRVQELERDNGQLTYQLQRIRGQLQRESTKSRKFEKEVGQFKGWLGKVLGLKRVVEGCQGTLMEEISSRLVNYSRA